MSAVIWTRYRDIPREEALKCATPEGVRVAHHKWENMRGQEVEIAVPAIKQLQSRYVSCEGPFFDIVGMPGYCVCPHIAEIGD